MSGSAERAVMPPPTDPAIDTDLLLELRFFAKADRLKLIRPAILAAARMSGFDEQLGHDIVLAVDEACQNIIIHGYQGRSDQRIALAAFRLSDGMELQLRDTAPTIDPATIRPRDLDHIRPGGLGTHFIQEVMDDIAFQPAPDGVGNLLSLTKRLPRPT